MGFFMCVRDTVLHLQVSPILELMTEATHWVFFWSVFMSRWTTFLNGEKRGAADAPSSCEAFAILHQNATLSTSNFLILSTSIRKYDSLQNSIEKKKIIQAPPFSDWNRQNLILIPADALCSLKNSSYA